MEVDLRKNFLSEVASELGKKFLSEVASELGTKQLYSSLYGPQANDKV